jgi:CheY-like chemotaxis protein
VDDSDINQEVARRILEREGMQVTTRSDGQQAVDLLRARPNDFDLVLMDVQMPIMDGNTATREIRQTLQLRDLPIIALTAGALVTERQRTIEAGMNDFVTKPLDPKALVSTVSRFVELLRRNKPKEDADNATPPLATVSGSNEAEGTDTSAGEWPAIEGVDGPTVAALLNNDVELFISLITRFVEDYAEYCRFQPPTSVNADECKSLIQRMHKLKGTAGTLGVTTVQRIAGELEMHLKNNGAPTEKAGWWNDLNGAMNSLTDQVNALQLTLAGTPSISAAARALSASDIEALLTLLHNQDLAAIDQFNALAPSFSQAFGQAVLEGLQHEIGTLQFSKAAKQLQSLFDELQRTA